MSDLETNDSLVKDPEGGEDYFSMVEEVGVFGFDTEETAEITRANNVTLSDYKETAKQAVQAFEDAGVRDCQ